MNTTLIQQTVIHTWPDGRQYIPCEGGMVRYLDGATDQTDAYPLDEYEAPAGSEWTVGEYDEAGIAEGYEVWRCTTDGQVSSCYTAEHLSDAEDVCQHYTAGPDGPAVGARYAVYLVVAR